MVDESKLDIKKVLEQGSQHTTLSDLHNKGIRNVKVLDERAILDLINQAVDHVISTQTQEERSKILADSRKQLQKLLDERDQFMSQANLLEVGKNELVQQIENLQNELKLRREIEEQGESSFQAQLKEIVDRHTAAQNQLQDLQSENAWLREEHDRMVEELDRALSENKSLKEEIERLRAAESDQSALQGELDSARAERDELKDLLSKEQSRGQESLQELKADHARKAQELDEAREQIDALRGEIEGEREKARQAEEKASAPLAQAEHDLDEARQEAVQLKAKLEEQAERERHPKESHAEPDWLKQDQTKPKAEAPPPEAPAEPPEPPKKEPIVLLERISSAVSGAVPVEPGDARKGKGLDIGTVNLVASEQNDNGEVELRLRRNAFIDIEITAYTKSMLTRLKVPYVIQAKRMYVLGEEAFELANVLNRNTRRPMRDGLISPKEQDALPVMKLLIGSILGEPRVPNEVCFYSVPGDPIDSELTVAYHRDLFDAVLKALGYNPRHIIEGHAVTFAELADEDFTGIGISCGGGMFNVCVAYKSMPALTFSSARSGDWVDQNVAQVLGVKPAKASLIKEKGVDLVNPKSREEDAIAIYYRNLIQYNLTNIAERFRAAENMPSFPEPITIVFSGGTALAGNFIELVRDVFKGLDFPIPVKELRLAKDPLHATAKGALAAAILEMSTQAA